MKSHGKGGDRRKAYIRRMENPYLSLSLFDEPEAPATPEPTLEQKHAYFRKLQNPHAHDSIFGDPDDLPAQAPDVMVQDRRTGGISKQAFQTGCRRIFTQYLTSVATKVLPNHYREFTQRNEQLTPGQRQLVLEELQKYDLSTEGNLKPQFNRERELLTRRKLQQIENAALNRPQ